MEAVILIRTFLADSLFSVPYVQLNDTWDLFIVNSLLIAIILLTAFIIFRFFKLLFHIIGG